MDTTLLFSSSEKHVSSFGYGWFGVLGDVRWPIATLLPVVFYRLRDVFRSLPIPHLP